MNIFRLLLFFLFGLLIRRFYLSLKSRVISASPGSARRPGTQDVSSPLPPDPPLKDLTEQDISDADFEEIP